MARRKKQVQQQEVVDSDDGPVQGNDEIATKVWKWWRQSRTHLSQWRQETAESYDIVAGRQWTDEEVKALTEQSRIPVTFNRTGVVLDSVQGYQINSRQDVAYLPREVEDTGPVQVETEAAKYYRQQCDAEDEESDSFYDTLVCGVGVLEHRMDYEDDPDGMLKIERVDPMEMGYDPSATKRNLIDRRWDVRGKWWDKEAAERMFPDHEFDEENNIAGDMDDLNERKPVDRSLAPFYADPSIGEQNDRRRDKVFIIEATWFENESFISAANPMTGKLEEVDEETLAQLNLKMAQAGMPEIKSVNRLRRVFKRAFVHGRDTLNLDDMEAPCPSRFHYQFITGKRDRNRNVWFGLVRPMKDPQRWANKFMSQTMHMINANAKGGVIHDKGAFDRPDEIENKLAKPGWRIEKNAGHEVEFVPPAQIPNNTFELMQFSIQSSRDVTGVNLELLGMTDRDQPGVLEHSRKQSAMAILAPFFDSLRRYHKESGRLTLYFIKQYMSDGRLIRIVGDGQKRFVPLTKTEGFDKYDVIVDQSPSSPNIKEAVFGMLIQVLPSLMKAGIPVPPDMLDYIPSLPASLTQAWKDMISKPNPEAEKAKQLEMADKAADVNKKGAETALSQAKAEREAAAAGIDQATAMAQILQILQSIQSGNVQTSLAVGDQQMAQTDQAMQARQQMQGEQQQALDNQHRADEAARQQQQQQAENQFRAQEMAQQPTVPNA